MRKNVRILMVPTDAPSRLYQDIQTGLYFTTDKNQNPDVESSINYMLCGVIYQTVFPHNKVVIDNEIFIAEAGVTGNVIVKQDGLAIPILKGNVVYATSCPATTPINRFPDSFVDRWAVQFNLNNPIDDTHLEFDDEDRLKIRTNGTVYVHRARSFSIMELEETVVAFHHYLSENQIEPEDIPDWLLGQLRFKGWLP